jgi:hypothetical protein
MQVAIIQFHKNRQSTYSVEYSRPSDPIHTNYDRRYYPSNEVHIGQYIWLRPLDLLYSLTYNTLGYQRLITLTGRYTRVLHLGVIGKGKDSMFLCFA